MENKEMNMYQKIATLQEVIKVNKGNRNDYADFNYRTIQDIFAELKPQLKELNLIINFGAGKLDGDKYTLEMRVIDINNPQDMIIEVGEIYIDRNKSKMDLSQKVLSAKTFLKKSLLEDLLLISEEPDPDGHDNTKPATTTTTTTATKPATKAATKAATKTTINVEESRKKLMNILYYAANKDKDEMNVLLKKYTGFTANGKEIPGVDYVDKLNDKRLEVTLSKVIKLYPEINKSIESKTKK